MPVWQDLTMGIPVKLSSPAKPGSPILRLFRSRLSLLVGAFEDFAVVFDLEMLIRGGSSTSAGVGAGAASSRMTVSLRDSPRSVLADQQRSHGSTGTN